MKRLVFVVAIIVALSSTAFAGDTTIKTSNDTKQSAGEPSNPHTKQLQRIGCLAVNLPIVMTLAPIMALASPHHGIEIANDYTGGIENPVANIAVNVTMAPLRAAAVVLAAPYYSLAWMGIIPL